MCVHDLARGGSHLGVREIARRRQRTEDEIRRDHERRDADQSDREVEPAHVVVESERSRLPEQQIPGLANKRGGRGASRRGDDDECKRDQPAGNEHERRAERAGPQADRLVPDVKSAAARPEDRGGDEVADRFLEVEPFEEVEDA